MYYMIKVSTIGRDALHPPHWGSHASSPLWLGIPGLALVIGGPPRFVHAVRGLGPPLRRGWGSLASSLGVRASYSALGGRTARRPGRRSGLGLPGGPSSLLGLVGV